MAVLSVLEGDGAPELLGHGSKLRRIRKKNPPLLGRSRIRRIGHGLAKAGRATGHVYATAGRAIGHAVAQSSRVTNRVIHRLVRGAARKILLHGDGFVGSCGGIPMSGASVTTMSKGAAVTAVTTAGTAAVAATLTPAIAAGAAPIIAVAAKGAVDEIYSKVKKKITGGSPPEEALADVEKTFKDEPSFDFKKYLLPAGIAALAFLALSGRRRQTIVMTGTPTK